MTEKPLPPVTNDTAAFWALCEDEVLSFQRCAGCGRAQFYPGSVCRTCHATAMEWETSSGIGEVHSFTVVHRAPTPAFKADVPYVLTLVEMAEGFRIMANLLDCDRRKVKIGMAVRVIFEPRGSDRRKLPQVVPWS